jgi:acyl-CoA synthetase (AMP-forming)/AMP-acid ligase II
MLYILYVLFCLAGANDDSHLVDVILLQIETRQVQSKISDSGGYHSGHVGIRTTDDGTGERVAKVVSSGASGFSPLDIVPVSAVSPELRTAGARIFRSRCILLCVAAVLVSLFLATDAGGRLAWIHDTAAAPMQSKKLDEESFETSQDWVEPAQATNASAFLKSASSMVISDLLPDTDDPFILSMDGRAALTYRRLRRFLESGDADVSSFGVDRYDRLAVMIKNGPEAAVALFAFSSQCTFAPIDPNLSTAELDFELSDLPAKAVVVQSDDVYKVHEAGGGDAKRSVIILESSLDVAGLFSLSVGGATAAPGASLSGSVGRWLSGTTQKPASPRDIALVLHTSGTTRKPKLVPLTHSNLILGALCIKDTLSLSSSERCLNMMPLFHIGGLSSNILSTAAGGAAVVCAAASFNGADGLRWLCEQRPSWYYAGPTIHQLIMYEMGNTPLVSGSLKFIRSGSAALLPSVAASMQKAFTCTVLPTYSMTECMPVCSHRVGSLVKLASVGPAAAPDLQIDKRGEVIIRGPCVTSGYERRDHMAGDDPNVEAFAGGWFRTGDSGSIDGNGYVVLSGRFKEIINRGGEKISPFEVEDAVIHRAVQERVAFAVPHRELGEVVGLGVRTSMADGELGALLESIRESMQGGKLPDKWLPEIIVKMDVLPKGGTGKLKRIGLANHLGLPTLSALEAKSTAAYVFRAGSLHELEGVTGIVSFVDSMGMHRTMASSQRDGRETFLAVYAVAAFGVVGEHTIWGVHFVEYTYPWTLAIMELMTSIELTTKLSLTAFIICGAYLNGPGPAQYGRIAALIAIYFLMCESRLPALCLWIHHMVSQRPYEELHFSSGFRRYFILIVLFVYVAYLVLRRLPMPAVYQSIVCAIVSVYLAWIGVPHDAPATFGEAMRTPLIFGGYSPSLWERLLRFYDMPHGGAHTVAWYLAVFIFVAAYGHQIVRRIHNHRLARSFLVRSAVRVLALVLFLSMHVPLYCGLKLYINREVPPFSDDSTYGDIKCAFALFTGEGTFASFLVEAPSTVVMIALLGFMVQPIEHLIAPIGSCALGIFVAHSFFMCSVDGDSSFRITLFGIDVLPSLQQTIIMHAHQSFFQLLCVPFYVVTCMLFTGVPFQYTYMAFVSQIEVLSRRLTRCNAK